MINFKLVKAKFGWTYSGFIHLNLIMVVSLVVVAITDAHSFQKVISVLPKGIMIMSILNFVIMPIVDLIENFKDQKMCEKLKQNYESEFLYEFDVKQKGNIRENYKNLTDYAGFNLETLAHNKPLNRDK